MRETRHAHSYRMLDDQSNSSLRFTNKKKGALIYRVTFLPPRTVSFFFPPPSFYTEQVIFRAHCAICKSYARTVRRSKFFYPLLRLFCESSRITRVGHISFSNETRPPTTTVFEKKILKVLTNRERYNSPLLFLLFLLFRSKSLLQQGKCSKPPIHRAYKNRANNNTLVPKLAQKSLVSLVS